MRYTSFSYFARSEDKNAVANLVHLEEDQDNENTDRINRIRKAVWGMLYPDGAGVVLSHRMA